MILRLDNAGLPLAWVSASAAAHFLAKDQVTWSLGEEVRLLHGGTNRDGVRSTFSIPAIIATHGNSGHRNINKVPALHNKALFARDGYLCLYCGKNRATGGQHFRLTRDHVIPQGQGGPDTWANTVTACSRCNNLKACRTPSEANMPLLAVPYTPNFCEALVLSNRGILADQMDFLKTFCKQEQFV